MGLFGGTKERSVAAPRERALRAAGMRITTPASGTDVGNDLVRALAATRQEWQADAWGYRDKIGELRFAFQFLARAVSRVKFLAAQSEADEDDPIPLAADKGVTVPAALRKAAQEELARLPLESGFRFLGVLTENVQVAGECWVHGYERAGREHWEVLSVDEVNAGQDGRFTIRRYGTAVQEPVDLAKEEMLRIWTPHSRYQIVADSPMRALMSVCEEIVLSGREMRAASRSRFSSNGLLFVPDGLTLINALKDDRGLLDDESFVADLYAAMMAPIANEGDPGQVAPVVITGNPDDIDKVKHVRLDRETDDKLMDRIERSLARLARGLDIPPEIITGMSDANHWTAWQIDASTYRYSIDPLVRVVADSLTEAFLRPALEARGFTPEQTKLVQVWYDAGNITENPNRGQDARDAFDRGAISYDTLRQALGFNDSDAPDDKEILRMVAQRIGVDTGTAASLLTALFDKSNALLGEKEPATTPPPRQLPPPPQDSPQQPASEDQATPDTAPAELSAGAARILTRLGITAAGEPESGWELDTEHGHRLMEVDRSMRDQLLALADGAVTRALEKAGARVRSKAQKDAQMRAMVASAPDVLTVAALLGPDRVRVELALRDDELFAEALAALHGKFTRIVGAGIDRVVAIVLALLRVRPDSERGQALAERLRGQMSSRVDGGWKRFQQNLNGLMSKYLYNPHPDEEPGEAPDSVVPVALVRDALAYVGGDDTGGEGRHAAGGVALGISASSTLEQEGAVGVGFEWAYGITPIRHFEPHRELDGQRFSGWLDPALRTGERYAWVGPYFQPGDHAGCMCDYVPSYAVREYAEVVSDRLRDETPNARADRLLAESDDAAGRTGTTAQLARDERARIQALQSRYIKAGRNG